MIQGLYAAANGMMAVEDRQAVIANNIANVTTPGFKRQVAVQQGFYEQFFGKMRSAAAFNMEKAPGGGVKVVQTFTQFVAGAVTQTGNPLDLALLGPGFLRVDTPEGERFTRNGRLSIGAAGELVTDQGHRVLGDDGGVIDVSGGLIEIDETGTVSVNGEVRGQLGLVEFEDRHLLTRAGYTLYAASQAALARSNPATNTTVSSGGIEMSNVQLPSEMVQMMAALRAYAANQRVLSAIDETTSRLIDQVGAPS